MPSTRSNKLAPGCSDEFAAVEGCHLLFTDIEGSTRRWETDADAMQVALEAHDETLRQAIARCGGRVFKHTGDGICAVFGSPHAAVDAAVAAQRCLELPVRMGIATGEAQERGAVTITSVRC
jgi:class 3 adenylate cyclase